LESDKMTNNSSNGGSGLSLNPDALRNLDLRIQRDIDEGRNFGASIIVARGGVIGHQRTFGTVAPGRDAAADDLYLAMSLSKSFTAALVLRAIDQGKLTLDTKAASIIPAFAAGGKQRVTVRHLLTHTGGTYSGLMPPPPIPPQEMGDLAKNVQAVSALPAANRPGERVVYNPFAGYAVLAQMLVEIDTQRRSFSQIARQDLFEPLGMMDTTYGLATDAPRRVPVSFTESNTTQMTPMVAGLFNTAINEDCELPAGSAFSTAEDVFRFAECLRQRGDNGNYRLISQSLFDYACQNHTGDMTNGAWDFYVEANNMPSLPAMFSLLGGYVRGYGHHMSGAGVTASPSAFYAVGGGSTMWLVDPERDLTFVFLSAGFIEGLAHFERLQTLSDLALACCVD
jgi:CubicO group peptidase (beta-lactamase class C family)